MQLNITTDYALRALMYLAKTGQVVSTSKIAEEMNIPINYLPSIMQQLRSAGIVKVKRGAKGGSYLAKSAEDITLFEVVETMETTTRLNRCLEPDGYCNRNVDEQCKLQDLYCKIQKKMDNCFKSITLKDLV